MNHKLSVDDLIAKIGELPPMPQVAQKALTLIRDPDSNMSDLGAVLSLDQAMASLVLKWANSAYYGLRNPVSTVQQAAAYLGMRTLHSLVLAASVAAWFDRPAPGYGLERGDLWKHSIGVAAGARLIANQFGNEVAEEAYHAGLLCDIGKLGFEILLRNVDTNAPEWQNQSFIDLEIAHFGVDHATLGAEMARRWHLPEGLVDTIAHHHSPADATEGALLAAAVHISDGAMMMLGGGIGREGLQYELDPVACERVGWNDLMFASLVERVLPFIDDANFLIQPRRN